MRQKVRYGVERRRYARASPHRSRERRHLVAKSFLLVTDAARPPDDTRNTRNTRRDRPDANHRHAPQDGAQRLALRRHVSRSSHTARAQGPPRASARAEQPPSRAAACAPHLRRARRPPRSAAGLQHAASRLEASPARHTRQVHQHTVRSHATTKARGGAASARNARAGRSAARAARGAHTRAHAARCVHVPRCGAAPGRVSGSSAS